MKKFLLSIAVAICSITAASAQFSEGDSAITARIGFGGGFGVPITVNYEKALWGINDVSCVTLGGTVAYAQQKESYYKITDFVIGARSNYHYAIKKWDLFGGVTLGYDVASVKWTDEKMKEILGSVSAGGFFFGLNIGVNYFISEKFAVGVDYGYGLAALNIGATMKF